MILPVETTAGVGERNWNQLLLDALPDQVYAKDLQHRFVFVNAATARFFNLPPHEIVGRSDGDFFPEGLAEQFRVEEQALLESGKPIINREARVIDQMGRPRWVLTTKVVLKDEEGTRVGLIGINRDITATKLIEDQMRLLAAALKATGSGVVITDKIGTILWINPAFTRLTGYQWAEIIGQNPRFLKSGRHDPEYYRQMWQTISAGNVWSGEIMNRCKDGSLSVEEMTITPLRDAAGEISHYIAIKQDIRAHKQAEEQLRQLNADLAHSQVELLKVHENLKQTQAQLIQAGKLESIARLATGVAHEVKNPLAILLMGVGYLDDALPASNPILTGVLRDMRDSIERANVIVHELLDFAAPQQLELSDENVTRVIERALSLVRHELQQRRIIVMREFAEDLPPRRMDRIKIEQVFVNVIMNACHSMPDGGTLTVRTYGRDGAVVAEVRDTGRGIPAEVLPRIFDPFFTTKPAGMGSGMGLAVAKNILTQHAGHIELANHPDGGVVATIVLNNRKETQNDPQTNLAGGR